MGKVKELLQNSSCITRVRLLKEFLYYYFRYATYSGAVHKKKSAEKYRASLLIAIHSIEKGLSLPDPKVGFGEKKIGELLKELERYVCVYGDDLLFVAQPVLEAYFRFNEQAGHLNKGLFDSYKGMFGEVDSTYAGGIRHISKSEVKSAVSLDYSKFVTSRHSVREFSSVPVDRAIIMKALQLSSQSPSACNRQPWHVYVYRGELKKELLLWQQGNRGFTDSIDSVILVACSLKSYFINEQNLAYVDGGLYAMNLINAFHSLGVGTIPLTMAVMSKRMNGFYEQFKIRKEDVPVILIGIGNLKDSFRVAVSERFSADDYSEIIE